MNIIEAIILGIVQGLTEFIPVSSSGHLELIPRIFSWQSPSTAYVTFLHVGTGLALIFFYRSLIFKYIKVLIKFIKDKRNLKKEEKLELKTILNVLLASIPAAILGILFEKVVSGFYDNPENTYTAGVMTCVAMIAVGIIFIFAHRFFKQKKYDLDKLSGRNAFIIGIAQVFAFFRGVSRSGITILTGQALGLKRVDAAEFGFLMSIPIVLGTSVYSIYKLTTEANFQQDIIPALVGLAFSFIFGVLAIKFMLQFLKNNGLFNFGIYRIIFGVVMLLAIIT